MNWEAIGALGEVVGALAVILTLLYLAVQIRHSKKLLEENQRIAVSQTFQTRAAMRMDSFRFGLDPQDADVLSRTVAPTAKERISNFERLSPSEQVQMRSYYSMNLQALDNTLYQGSLGLIEESQLQIARNSIQDFYPTWIASNANIPPRIEEWYAENVLEPDA